MSGLYIHIPFCRRKCGYCDFVSIEAVPDDTINSYLKALSSDSARYKGRSVDTVYIGGGTPSVLTIRQIKKLFSIINRDYRLNGKSEITFEANPESIDKSKLSFLKIAGVNRISFGFQSFNGKYLRMLGRVHSTETAVSAYHSARDAGFNNINIDLISGLPFQKLSEFADELKRASVLEPDHISVYELTLKKGCGMYKLGKYIDQETAADIYEHTNAYLKGRGYRRYEISNYAAKNRECVHNKNYWLCGEYIGLGCSACSFLSGQRYSNTGSLKEYIRGGISGSLKRRQVEKLDTEGLMLERFIVGLRMADGITYTKDEEKLFRKKLENYEKSGHIAWLKNRVKLTPKGMAVANTILLSILP